MDRLRDRLLPALVTAFGVTFLAAGLLSCTTPAVAEVPLESPTSVEVGDPGASDGVSALPSLPTLPPITEPPSTPPSPSASPSASAGPTWVKGRVATRVVYPALDIDLPVVKPPGGENAYPLCNVAMYIQQLGQPGQGRATYLYAHARTGMFLPILTESKVDNGRGMLGDIVEVYTSDDQHFLYQVYAVRRHVTSLDRAAAVKRDELWLQTSEGPRGTPGKTQVLARFLSQEPADHAKAHPKPKPVVCG